MSYVSGDDTMPETVERSYLYFERGWLPVVGQLELHSEQPTGPISHRFALGYELTHFSGASDRGDTGDAVPGPIDYVYPVDQAEETSLQQTAVDHYRHVAHSVYGFDHITLFDGLIVTGGLRFDSVHSRVQREFLDRFSGEQIDEPDTDERRPALTTDRQALTGQAGIVYSPWKPLTGYVGYSSSFKPVFISPSNLEVNEWDPERGNQIEGGLRVRVEQNRHRFNFDGAGYYIEKRNVVVPRGPDDFAQAGKLHSRGVDLTVGYRAPAWVELTAGYSLTAAEYSNFVQPDPVTGENVSLGGNQLPFTPLHSATAWLRFLMSDQLGIGFGGRFMVEQHADPENRVELPDYALFDASAWFDGEQASFILSVRNLFDEHDYFTSSINTWATNPQVTPGPGREVLGTVRLKL